MMANSEMGGRSPSPHTASGATRRRRTDVLVAQVVLGVAAAASVIALAISALAPELAQRSLDAARKDGGQTPAIGEGLSTLVAEQRIRDVQREVVAALEQAAIAADRARLAAEQGRSVLEATRAMIGQGGEGIVQTRTPEGDLFQGQAENGRPQGYGLVRRAAGGVFASFFIDGESRGAAAFCAQADCRGEVYFGDYRNNQPTGFGEGAAGGGTYRGEFKEGLPDGYGEYAYPGGEIYRGGFVAGARQGFGVMTLPDKSVQAGFWNANVLRIPAPIPEPAPAALDQNPPPEQPANQPSAPPVSPP